MYCKNCGKEIKPTAKFCNNCGEEIKIGRFNILRDNLAFFFRRHKKAIFITSGIIFLIFILLIINTETEVGSDSPKQNLSNSFDQNKIASSVVNIFCPSTVPDEDVSGGSGTIIDSNGIIITNSHIIPQDEKNLFVSEEGCLVALVDPITGKPESFYLAKPVVIPDISDKYDLAFMSIYSAYYDEEEQRYAGVYPREFPALDGCENESARLGEPVRIFGYPSISGGYSLTITDGIVSSFPEDGFIMTSAKVSYGNSGGLAVDENGCMMGIPSMVSSDENASLGIIISMDLINEFADKVSLYLKDYK